MDLGENAQAAQLLSELDQRQDQVLAELDELNTRIEKVIELYLESRRFTAAQAATTPMESAPLHAITNEAVPVQAAVRTRAA